jgi:hypothetical protein
LLDQERRLQVELAEGDRGQLDEKADKARPLSDDSASFL